jgi:hypothetical protein
MAIILVIKFKASGNYKLFHIFHIYRLGMAGVGEGWWVKSRNVGKCGMDHAF